MCFHPEDYEELDAAPEHKQENKISEIKDLHVRRLRADLNEVKGMDWREYKAKFLAPPEKNIVVSILDEHKRDAKWAKYDGKKIVIFDLRRSDNGAVNLVAVDEDGLVIETLLTFSTDGVVDRHSNLDEDLGLKLSQDGSWRGRLALREAPSART